MAKKNTKRAGAKPATTTGLLRAALRLAAVEAYKAEVIHTDMQSVVIGEDKDYATADEWMDARIDEWLGEAAKELKAEPRTLTLPAVRVSLVEQEAIARNAARMNLSVSEYVRRQAMR